MVDIASAIGLVAGIAVAFIFPELAPILINAINAIVELRMYEATRKALEEKIIPMNIQFGEELWAIEKKNLARQETYWSEVWGAQSKLMYKSCENKQARATIGNRYEIALNRDALLKGTNMYGVGLRSEIINRCISKDLHSSGQMAVSAKWHEDNHILDSMTKYYDLVSTMMKEVPYGNLPAFLGRVGDAYEGLLLMHSNSFNNSIASMVGAYDRMVNDGYAETSVKKDDRPKQDVLIEERGQDYSYDLENTSFDNVYTKPDNDIERTKRLIEKTGERG